MTDPSRIRSRLLTAALLLPVLFFSPTSADTAAAATGERAGPTAEIGVGQERWQWPIGPPRKVSHGFEAPATRYSAGHRGIDLSALPGTPVIAPVSGTVFFVGTVVDRPVLTLRVEGDLLLSFEPIVPVVSVGQAVQAGDPLGTVAQGGHCDGGCLHFGVRLHGEYVSPMLYLAGVPRAVLLPLRD